MTGERYAQIKERAYALARAIIEGDATAISEALPSRQTDPDWGHVLAMAGIILASAVMKGTGGTIGAARDLLKGVWSRVHITLEGVSVN